MGKYIDLQKLERDIEKIKSTVNCNFEIETEAEIKKLIDMLCKVHDQSALVNQKIEAEYKKEIKANRTASSVLNNIEIDLISNLEFLKADGWDMSEIKKIYIKAIEKGLKEKGNK